MQQQKATVVAIIVTWALTGIGFVYWIADDRSAVVGRVGNIETIVSDHEVRIRTTERLMNQEITEIKNDIKWIRRQIESHAP